LTPEEQQERHQQLAREAYEEAMAIHQK